MRSNDRSLLTERYVLSALINAIYRTPDPAIERRNIYSTQHFRTICSLQICPIKMCLTFAKLSVVITLNY